MEKLATSLAFRDVSCRLRYQVVRVFYFYFAGNKKETYMQTNFPCFFLFLRFILYDIMYVLLFK